MAQSRVEAGEKFNLISSDGASARGRTAALVKTDRFEAIRLVLSKGSSVAPHAVRGHVILQCLRGEVRLDAKAPIILGAGDWIYLDRGEQHGLMAIDDSALLLTIMFD